MTFRDELEVLINRHSIENGSNTPDFILAEYLTRCLFAFEAATNHRERWYGKPKSPGGGNEATHKNQKSQQAKLRGGRK